MKHKVEARKLVFSKIFRWHPPHSHGHGHGHGHTHGHGHGHSAAEAPKTVEVTGTFTHWQPVPMIREVSGGWHLTLHDIPGNRTHHYMFLADGKPVQDKHSDGLAVPHGAEEEKFAITTARGPRVSMLFAQTK